MIKCEKCDCITTTSPCNTCLLNMYEDIMHGPRETPSKTETVKVNVGGEMLGMKVKTYSGYVVGVGIEHKGVIVSAPNIKDLMEQFKQTVPSYRRCLKKFRIQE